MPQSPSRKREYMREYMAARRQATRDSLPKKVSLKQGLTTVKSRVHTKREDVSPFTGRVFEYWGEVVAFPGVYPLARRYLIGYLAAVNAQGFGLTKTSQGYEFVDLATGEIGLGCPLPSRETVYEQQPSYKRLQERVEALEGRILVLETDAVVEGVHVG